MSKKMSRKIEGLLKEIRETLRNLDRKINKLNVRSYSTVPGFMPGTLWSLPEHLRKSMEAIATLGEATAQQLSEKTGRSRAAESDYLNQLADRGFLKKQRRGKEMIFQVFNLRTICPMCGSRVLITAKYCNRCGATLEVSPAHLPIPRAATSR
jgi:predicted HTH transcriptional regulator